MIKVLLYSVIPEEKPKALYPLNESSSNHVVMMNQLEWLTSKSKFRKSNLRVTRATYPVSGDTIKCPPIYTDAGEGEEAPNHPTKREIHYNALVQQWKSKFADEKDHNTTINPQNDWIPRMRWCHPLDRLQPTSTPLPCLNMDGVRSVTQGLGIELRYDLRSILESELQEDTFKKDSRTSIMGRMFKLSFSCCDDEKTVNETDDQTVDTAKDSHRPHTADTAKESHRPHTADTAKDSQRPHTAVTTKDSHRPHTADTAKESHRPHTAVTTKDSHRPHTADTTKESHRPHTADTTKESHRPHTAVTAKESHRPHTADTAKESHRPHTADTAKDSQRPHTAVTTKDSHRPHTADTTKESHRPHTAVTAKESHRPHTADTAKDSQRPRMVEAKDSLITPGKKSSDAQQKDVATTKDSQSLECLDISSKNKKIHVDMSTFLQEVLACSEEKEHPGDKFHQRPHKLKGNTLATLKSPEEVKIKRSASKKVDRVPVVPLTNHQVVLFGLVGDGYHKQFRPLVTEKELKGKINETNLQSREKSTSKQNKQTTMEKASIKPKRRNTVVHFKSFEDILQPRRNKASMISLHRKKMLDKEMNSSNYKRSMDDTISDSTENSENVVTKTEDYVFGPPELGKPDPWPANRFPFKFQGHYTSIDTREPWQVVNRPIPHVLVPQLHNVSFIEPLTKKASRKADHTSSKITPSRIKKDKLNEKMQHTPMTYPFFSDGLTRGLASCRGGYRFSKMAQARVARARRL